MKKVKLLVVGAGCRGHGYARYVLDSPELAQVIGVAEPREYHRNRLAEEHNIPKENCYESWEQLAEREKFADAVIIATPDSEHTGPAVAFARKGYHMLLEKPMAPTEEECRQIVDEAVKNNIILAVCHVLRYTQYTAMLKKLLDDGVIGDIVSLQHLEPVGYWHFAHSYVRGNWRNEAESAPMLLAKSCHDLDWIHYVVGNDCRQISSFGNLKHFRSENKPSGAGMRCVDCSVERECPYSAIKLYLDLMLDKGETRWPVDVITSDTTREGVLKALKEGPYGRCVYECDNDVCDHQVVNMLFDNKATATFTVTGFTEITARRTSIFGTKGELYGDGRYIKTYDFLTDKHSTIDTLSSGATVTSGHGGGDWGLMKNFIESVGTDDPSLIISGPKETLDSHLLVFYAEKARKENLVMEMD